jgi:hypothetical protein
VGVLCDSPNHTAVLVKRDTFSQSTSKEAIKSDNESHISIPSAKTFFPRQMAIINFNFDVVFFLRQMAIINFNFDINELSVTLKANSELLQLFF